MNSALENSFQEKLWYTLTVSPSGRDEEKWSELRRGKGNFGALHGSPRTQVSPMDERPSSSSSHRLRTPHSWSRVPDATIMEPRPKQFSFSLYHLHLFVSSHNFIKFLFGLCFKILGIDRNKVMFVFAILLNMVWIWGWLFQSRLSLYWIRNWLRENSSMEILVLRVSSLVFAL